MNVTYELIWACDEENGIGKDGSIPWNVPQDLNNFRRITTQGNKQNVVIMGRKTWDSIPKMFKPLKNRINVVITSDPNNVKDFEEYFEKVSFVENFDQALIIAELQHHYEGPTETFVIGGEMVYNEAILRPECVGVHETVIEGNYRCDTFCPCWSTETYDKVDSKALTDRAFYIYWRKKGTYEMIDDEDLVEEIIE